MPCTLPHPASIVHFYSSGWCESKARDTSRAAAQRKRRAISERQSGFYETTDAMNVQQSVEARAPMARKRPASVLPCLRCCRAETAGRRAKVWYCTHVASAQAKGVE